MSSWPIRRLDRLPSLWLLLLVGLSACQTVPTKTYDVRQRAFTYQPTSLVRDYQEEYAYIQKRQEAVAHGQSNGLSDHPLRPRPFPPTSPAWPFQQAASGRPRFI
jgi:hypothetical protein